MVRFSHGGWQGAIEGSERERMRVLCVCVNEGGFGETDWDSVIASMRILGNI